MMGAGRTFFCVFCLGLATLLLLQKRQYETVRKLGNTHQRDKSYKQQKTRDFLTEKRYLKVKKTASEVLPETASTGEIFVQPELSELAERYKARRELVARVCQEQAEDLETRLVLSLRLSQVFHNQGLSNQCPRVSSVRALCAPAQWAEFNFPRVSNLHLRTSV